MSTKKITGFEITGKSIQSLDSIKRELKELKFKFNCISGQFTTFDRYVVNSNMSREELMTKYHNSVKTDIDAMRKSLAKTQELLDTLESIIDTEYNEDNEE
jgi:cell division protein YceG involved in septum cleavage